MVPRLHAHALGQDLQNALQSLGQGPRGAQGIGNLVKQGQFVIHGLGLKYYFVEDDILIIHFR